MPATMTANDKAAFDGIKVGDIFVSSWGWEQTNVDFYKVVGKTAARIKVVKIGKRNTTSDGGWTGTSMPEPNTILSSKPTIKKVSAGWRGDGASFDVSSYASASLWDGKPESFSSYG